MNISDRAASGPNATTLFSLLNSTDSKVTVFAPTNEALASSLQGLVPDPVLAGNIVRNHLVVGMVGDTQLGNQGKFMTVGGATLYSTIVEYYDNSNIIAYSTSPYAGPTRTVSLCTIKINDILNRMQDRMKLHTAHTYTTHTTHTHTLIYT